MFDFSLMSWIVGTTVRLFVRFIALRCVSWEYKYAHDSSSAKLFPGGVVVVQNSLWFASGIVSAATACTLAGGLAVWLAGFWAEIFAARKQSN